MAYRRSAMVTGGAGFIGSHLVDRLVEENYRVIIVDDLSTGKLKNLNHDATFHHMSITQPTFPDDPILDNEVNVQGTLRLLEASRRAGVEKIIYSSTGGALYGEPEVVPCPDDAPVLPISPYGMSKYIGEQYLDFYSRQYRLNYTTLRYGNVYGPRQDPFGEAGVIAIFISAILSGKRPRIFGDGNQTRDFVCVDDIVEANIAAIHRGHRRSLNVATGELTSVNRLYEMLKEIVGFRWDAEHGPARAGDVYRISLDCSRAEEELGWVPKTSLAEGLARTVAYLREAAQAEGVLPG
ncbi:Putative UDP-glucose 4-epimerase [Geodia barretti]|uniref:UDP-glucose 4-epimerase n=1 Tax=Geodia barretti TaxID=519541 RepID=A0AA35SKK0_GEOBA|nr:Putative UDP-glucose 4-epimerase [Geodia barretti]